MIVNLINEKQVQITKIYNIIAYEIQSITITPNTSALLEIMLFCDDNELFNKRYLLISKEYSDWTTDDYLDVFISTNLKKNFNN